METPLHEAAVADDIRGKDGGEAALGAFFGHQGRRLSECAVR
jgi:hypothetical protein